MAPVAGEGLGQHHVGVVPGAGHHRHDGHGLRPELVEHRVEPGLALVKGGRDLVEEPPLPDHLGKAPHQRVRRRVPPGAMGREHQRAAAHDPTVRATSSAVGSSRPVMDARRPGRPISRW